MLEELDDIPWCDLHHAYGPATDVPQHLRGLCSRDKAVRQHARDKIWSSLVHQGTRYQASIYVVPFLAELLQSPQVPDRADIACILSSIAVGHIPDELARGFNVRLFRQELDELVEDCGFENESDDPYGPGVDRECYYTVLQYRPLYEQLLSDPDIEVRLEAANGLCWLADENCDVPTLLESAFIQRLKDGPNREALNLMLFYALACYRTECALKMELIKPFLDSPTFYIRVAAAIALARIAPDENIFKILEEGARCDEINELFDVIIYDGGQLKASCINLLVYEFGHDVKDYDY